MGSGCTNNFPWKWAWPKSRDPYNFGQYGRLGYPTDSLAFCWINSKSSGSTWIISNFHAKNQFLNDQLLFHLEFLDSKQHVQGVSWTARKILRVGYMSRLNWQFLPDFERISYKNSVHSHLLLKSSSHPRINHHARRKNVFSQRVISSRNSLPQHVVDATSVSTFKNRLDVHRKAVGYGQ